MKPRAMSWHSWPESARIVRSAGGVGAGAAAGSCGFILQSPNPFSSPCREPRRTPDTQQPGRTRALSRSRWPHLHVSAGAFRAGDSWRFDSRASSLQHAAGRRTKRGPGGDGCALVSLSSRTDVRSPELAGGASTHFVIPPTLSVLSPYCSVASRRLHPAFRRRNGPTHGVLPMELVRKRCLDGGAGHRRRRKQNSLSRQKQGKGAVTSSISPAEDPALLA